MPMKVSRRVRKVGQDKTGQGGAGWPVALAKMEPPNLRVSLVAGGFNAADSVVPREYFANPPPFRRLLEVNMITIEKFNGFFSHKEKPVDTDV
jgi:hypothetical protein